MENNNHEILEISSDEEDELGNINGGDWLSFLLDKVEKEDSDEVVVVGEVSRTCSVSKDDDYDDSDDSDDCLILDGDPEKHVQVANDDSGNNSDELLIVSEKGQLACRDYPHPRHLCARFPFGSNPHERYCDQCHCYVCDTQAPCMYWGTGVSSTDHCHSTDKEEIWKLQRKYFGQVNKAPSSALDDPANTLPIAPPVHKSIPALTHLQTLNSVHSQIPAVSNSPTLRSCSSTSNFGVPNIISNRNHQQSGVTVSRSRLPHQVASRSTALAPGSGSIASNIIRRDKDNGAGTLGPRFGSPQVNFKRVGSGAITLTKLRSGHGSHDKTNHIYGSQPQRNPDMPVTYSGIISTSSQEPRRSHHTLVTDGGVNSTRSQEAHRSGRVNSMRSQEAQRSRQTPVTYNNNGRARSQDFLVGNNSELNTCQSTSQSTMGSSFMESQSYDISMQPQVYGQTIPQPIDSQPQVYSQPIPQPSDSQPQVYSQPIPQSSDNQNTFTLENPAPNLSKSNLTDYQYDWLNDTVQNLAPPAENCVFPSMQPTSQPSTENSKLLCIQPMPQPSTVTGSTTQCPAATNPSLIDSDFDSWIWSLGDKSDHETGNETVRSELGFVPSQPELVNAAMLLFDFENS